MRLALVDISNSYTKMALAVDGKLGAKKRIATGKLTASELQRVTKTWRFDFAVVSCVAPDALSATTDLWGDLVHVLTHRSRLSVDIDFPQPGKIGADRLANAVGVRARYGIPAVVVDFGTAVTFDVVNAEGCYVGGVIAPGLEVMASYLYERTALLPKLSFAEPKSFIGKNTMEAMRIGSVAGYRGMIREILRLIRSELSPSERRRLKVVATGGYSELIAAQLPEIQQLDSDLTLHGLWEVGVLNCGLEQKLGG
ncbi:MAG: type III pantothenate kinase [Verrucomicrobiales bacterium]